MSEAAPRIRRLGEADYGETLAAMQRFTDDRGDATSDELWLLQHPRVFTQGVAGRAEHLLQPGDIPVVPVDRGGQVTYHGPGQWVLYFLLDLRRRRLGVRALVSLIEDSVVATLAGFGIDAAAHPARLQLPRPVAQRGHGPRALFAHQPLRLRGSRGHLRAQAAR